MWRTKTQFACLICLLALGVACAKSDNWGGEGGSTGAGGGAAAGTTGSVGGDTGAAGTTGTGGSASGSGGKGSGGVGTGGTGVGSGGTGITGTAGRGSGGAGTTGSAGRGSGGTTASGGTTGVAGRGGSTGAGGTGTATSCSFTVMSSLSSKIPTVGIVTWSTTLASPTSAQIDFGLDTTYGMTAPVDLTQTNYRTLLLGMKASKPYHFRVTASNASGSCVGNDNMITTGALPNGLLPTLTITTKNKTALTGGFLITSQYQGGALTSSAPAYIIDADGDYVWWYTDAVTQMTGARMSYDGTYMWINNANVPSGTTQVHRVTMDGLTDTDFSTPFSGANHQITPLPDGSVAFYAYNSSQGCDDIKIFPANGAASSTATTVVNSKKAHGGTGMCHCNNIEYSSDDDTLVFSDLDNDCITKVTKTGTTVWVLNGGTNGITNTFTGDTWAGGEHGIHVLSMNDLIIFNNNSKAGAVPGGGSGTVGDGSGSFAIEMQLDTSAKTAKKTWSYKANPGIQVDVMGDVQRMPNGNTVIGYSTKGELQEVDQSGNVLQDIKWPAGTSFGYINKRPTLYGPPLK
ncbi:MAG TPA: aryl-sulfate sulfotransferase [Polyangia bacterium]|nr:aryl-sulfate sulfotransferase [Polyangia bacterium]